MEKRLNKDYTERRAKNCLEGIKFLLEKNRDRLHEIENSMRKRLRSSDND